MIWRLAKDLDLTEFWPYGNLKGPKIENGASKNILSSWHPFTKIAKRHKQVSCEQFIGQFWEKLCGKVFGLVCQQVKRQF